MFLSAFYLITQNFYSISQLNDTAHLFVLCNKAAFRLRLEESMNNLHSPTL